MSSRFKYVIKLTRPEIKKILKKHGYNYFLDCPLNYKSGTLVFKTEEEYKLAKIYKDSWAKRSVTDEEFIRMGGNNDMFTILENMIGELIGSNLWRKF